MTKPAAILIAPQVALRQLPAAEREIVSRFLFNNIRGLDQQHDTRWKRLWGRLWKADPGEVFHIEIVVDRSGPFHKRHMAMEQALFDRQDQWLTLDELRWWLKTGAGWGDFVQPKRGPMKFVPRSTSYEACSDDEMKELHVAMLAFLRTPKSMHSLWPHLSPNARYEMLESILEPAERER